MQRWDTNSIILLDGTIDMFISNLVFFFVHTDNPLYPALLGEGGFWSHRKISFFFFFLIGNKEILLKKE